MQRQQLWLSVFFCLLLLIRISSTVVGTAFFSQPGSEKKCWEMRNDIFSVLSGRIEQRSPAVQWHFIMFVFLFLLKSQFQTLLIKNRNIVFLFSMEKIKIITPKLKSDQSYWIIDGSFLLPSSLSSFFLLLLSIVISPLVLSSTVTNYFILSMERRRQINKSPLWKLMGGRMEEGQEKVKQKVT